MTDAPLFSTDELERYARHIVLPDVGGAGQAKLKAAHILVIGAGGIGSPAIQYLAAAGVGRLSVMDADTVSLSNLQRQPIYATADIGASKTERAGQAVAAINPHVAFEAFEKRFQAGDTLPACDVLIDGTDNFAARLAIADAAYAQRLPLVSAALGRFQGQIGTFRGWEADAPCYRCFVGDAFDADDCDTCAEQGVLGAMAGMIGCWAALEAIRAITGFGQAPAGRMHIFDALAPAMRSVRIAKDPACKTCGAA